MYRCTWHRMPTDHKVGGYTCFWGLLFPGILEWSRTVLGQGQERPWHGYYSLSQLPDGASVLTSNDFPQQSETEAPR